MRYVKSLFLVVASHLAPLANEQMSTIEREISDATKLVMKRFRLSRSPLLENPMALQPHMHCPGGS